jgi:hypothetical protein
MASARKVTSVSPAAVTLGRRPSRRLTPPSSAARPVDSGPRSTLRRTAERVAVTQAVLDEIRYKQDEATLRVDALGEYRLGAVKPLRNEDLVEWLLARPERVRQRRVSGNCRAARRSSRG